MRKWGEERGFLVYSVFAVILNVVLTFVFACGTLCAAFMYRMKRLPGFAAIFAIFLSYIIDNTIVFCTEIIPAFADIYDRMFLETPSIKTVCFIIRISSMLYLLNRVLPEFSLNAVVFFSALHAFSLICAPLISRPDWMVYFYYFFSQIIIICVCTWALFRIRKSDHADLPEKQPNMMRVILYFLFMTVLVLAEDTYVIFFVDVYTTNGLNIFNRNLSENLLFVGFAMGFIWYTVRFINTLAASAATDAGDVAAVQEQQFDPVWQFASGFNLTERELEILRCVLNGKSQQEISHALVIALGTVKTHTHNIYSKAGASNRSQIIAMYQDFLRLSGADDEA